MAYGDPNNPNVGADINAPLTGWTSPMPSTTFAPNGGIGGDWRFPSENVDPRLMPTGPGIMTPRVLRNPAPAPSLANAPLPPVRPNINVPVGQVAQSGSGSLWDALRALFSGQPAAQAQAQGMTGMLQSPRGQGARGTDALGNPFNRFG